MLNTFKRNKENENKSQEEIQKKERKSSLMKNKSLAAHSSIYTFQASSIFIKLCKFNSFVPVAEASELF